MARPFTISDIKQSKVAAINQHLIKPAVKKDKYSKEKYWVNFKLEAFAREQGLELKTEHRFHEVRHWRFDWAIPDLGLAFEYNGIFSKKSRHTTPTGYTGDMDKLNEAQRLGWTVIQYTAINYTDLVIYLNTVKR